MLVSLTYLRVLMLLSFLAAEIVLWITNIRQLFYTGASFPLPFHAFTDTIRILLYVQHR